MQAILEFNCSICEYYGAYILMVKSRYVNGQYLLRAQIMIYCLQMRQIHTAWFQGTQYYILRKKMKKYFVLRKFP